MAIQLIIIGLRRSGTTIFWQSFRQDRRLVCYDEPLSPLLLDLTGSKRELIKNPEEYDALLCDDSRGFWDRFAPMDAAEELREGFSDRQVEYLRFLGETGSRVAFDTTRCNFKIEALHQLAPDAALVHLYRPPAANATSHMLPTSANRLRTRVRRYLNTRDFWTRGDRFNYWHFESIVGNSPRSFFADRLREIGLDPAEIYSLPAVAKLMAFWRVNHERAERDGPRWFGERFVSLTLDDYCRDPAVATQKIYGAMGLDPARIDYSRVHRAKGPYQPESPEWSRYSELLGLPRI